MDKKNKSILSGRIFTIALTVITLSFLAYFVFALFDCSDYFENEAKSVAQTYALQSTKQLEDGIDENFNHLKNVAADLVGVSGYDNFESIGNQYVNKYSIDCLQFLHEGHAEYRFSYTDEDGNPRVGSSTAAEVKKIVEEGVFGCSAVYRDMSLGADCIAVFCPVTGNSEIDGILGYYYVTTVLPDRSDTPLIKYYCLADENGDIFESYSAEGFKTDVSHNAFTYVLNLCETKPAVDEIQAAAKLSQGGSFRIIIDGEHYIVTTIFIRNFGSPCFTLHIFPVDGLLQSEYTLYDKLVGSALGLITLVVVILIVFLIISSTRRREMTVYDETDPLLGCNSYNRFVRETLEILTVNRFSGYAVVYFNINRFSYIRENFDATTSDETLRYIGMVIKKTVGENETYGHVIDDCFVALVHYADMRELGERIKLLDTLIANYDQAKINNFTVQIAVGVYPVERDKNFTVQEMVDRASIAQKIAQKNPDRPFIVYDASIRSSYLKEAEIEAKMEGALKNNEFKAFLQPKINILKDRVDGAEALVRWFDESTQSYMSPDQFIPLFEINRFISKLDRYIFTEVCRYMQECTRNGDRVVPISVNVSCVTATKPDFLEYYVKTKKKYEIADGFLTLEFTESFAYESYDVLERMVPRLKAAGFRCSIDDFGAGYSSFNTLKSLDMDELKLDRFFLRKGNNPKKDEILQRTIINLGKAFNMTVTQEGVETTEDMDLMTEYGCDVVQGYYYSRPLTMKAFTEFVNGDTSLRAAIRRNAGKDEK